MPRRSYSRETSHRSSWTTSSTRLDDRVEAMPNRSLTLIDAQAAKLHVMPREFGTRADENGFGPPADLHGVVRDEAMPAHDEIERALALADPALADDEHAETEDVHQHGVRDDSLGEGVFENRRQLRNRRRRRGTTS